MRVGVGEIGGELFGERPVRASISQPSARRRSSAEDGQVVGDNDFHRVAD